jgi:4-amino-4-deoxy-L-arabinose transferase-like glycosyltransferase
VTERLFPGDRRVWCWSLAILIPALALIAGWMLVPRSFYTGTDSIGPTGFIASVTAHQRLCETGVPLPADTGEVGLALGEPDKRAEVDLTVFANGRLLAHGSTSAAPEPPPEATNIRLTRAIPADAPNRTGSVCVRVVKGGLLQLAGFGGTFNGLRTTLDGKPVASSISVWLRPPAGQKRSLLASWGTMMHRLTLFRPGFTGVVFYWVLFLLGMPLLAYLGIRILAQAQLLSTRRLALGLMVIAFLGAAIWALSTNAFDAPDESEHFAYTELLAETGRAPSATPVPKPSHASDESLGIDAVHEYATNGEPVTRRPWFASQEHDYQRLVAREHPADNDGGGESIATSPHSPLYYALTVPGYELGHPSIFNELFWMRLSSALLAMVIAPLAFLTVRELMPSRPELAVGAGLLVGFQPMVSFVSGAVNNDNGVNALAALSVYLTVRIIRRGLTPVTAGVLGVSLGLLPLMKGTGFALFPAVAFALLALLARRRSLAALGSLALTAAGFGLVLGIWALVAHHFGRSVLPLPAGALAASSGLSPAGAAHSASGISASLHHFSSTLHDVYTKLIYVAEVFIPDLPGAHRDFVPGFWPFHYVYIKRGFADFGFGFVFFPEWVYTVITIVMGISAALGLCMIWRRWTAVRRHWLEAVFLLLVVLGVLGGVDFAYYSATPTLPSLIPEQGRYAFTALVPLAGLAVCGLASFRRGVATVSMTLLVGAMISLAAASHLLYLAANFT